VAVETMWKTVLKKSKKSPVKKKYSLDASTHFEFLLYTGFIHILAMILG
jgi:hypothetical protein